MNQKRLAALFRRLGAPDPESWARSEIEEGIPQLARWVFLRQAWSGVVDEKDKDWISQAIAEAADRPRDPYAGVGLALARLKKIGASDDDLTDVVRGMQAQLLFSLCYLLEDPGDLEPGVPELAWALVQIDEDGKVVGNIEGLHESVLEADPTGREMRPRPAKRRRR